MNLEQLVLRATRGDDEAFFEAVSLQKEKLYKVAYAFLHNENDALEAIQEATYRSYLKLSRLEHAAYFSTWLTRILIHVCIDEQKRKKRLLVDPIEVGNEQNRDLDIDLHEQTVERMYIEDALSRLTPAHRHIIILKYFEDRTIREIADVLGHPEGTIKTWLHKALGALRKDLRKGW
ncbi:sigma-70 family RNA polymerase sigma factor [Brevibacillus reuszeri]|uniref:sigma-70 family RNA polymerase sigma factor n=1 Tax=Brevibacillus reuszeri TaxID=54915 RepID=UPI003D1F0287